MKKIFLIISLGLGLISCDDYIDEAFRNPNAPTLVKPSEVLPAIQANMARGVQFDSRMLGRYVNYWTLTTAGGSWDRMGYDPNSDNGGEKWRTHYWNLGQNVVNMMRDARAEGKDEYIGAGHAIMAWSWLLLTDYHSDVILKEAFNTSQLTFKFDTQEDVYKHVAILCDSANVYIDKASKKEVSSDFRTADAFLYAGNIDKWKKFVSGVKAKLLHRYSLKSTYKPDDVIKAVDAALASTDDDAMIKFNNGPAAADDANFFGPRRNNLAAYRQTDFIIRYMDGTVYTGKKDPRIDFLFRPSTDGVFRGIRMNAGEATTLPANRKTYNFFGAVSTVAPAGGVDTDARSFFKNNAPLPLMTFSELQFIKAEAAFIKGDKATALSAYQKGIKACFDMYKKSFTGYVAFTDKQADDYITAISPKTAAELTLSDIMMQKFVALWGYGFEETWVDLRRYKYSPDIYKTYELPTAIYPDNLGKLVYRVRPRYNSEYLWNVEELRRIGGTNTDYHTLETWFAKP